MLRPSSTLCTHRGSAGKAELPAHTPAADQRLGSICKYGTGRGRAVAPRTPTECPSLAQAPPARAWFWLPARADLDVYYDRKIPPLNIRPPTASFPPAPLHHPRSTDRQTTTGTNKNPQAPNPKRHGGRSSEQARMGRAEQRWHRQPQVSPECSQLQLQNGPEPLDFITPLLDNAD